MSKHTPGPWEAHTSRYLKFATVVIADVAHEIRSECSEADARLISAAPELLEALQMVARSSFLPTVGTTRAAVEAAIAKATGETK